MGDIDRLDLKPWQKLPAESNSAFHGFTHFLNLLPWERSMDRAYTQHQKICKHSTNPRQLLSCDPGWNDWRFKFSWLERAAAHDAEIAERDRLRRVHEIEQMNQRHTNIAVALQNLVVERLQSKVTDLHKMTPLQMASLLDKVTLVERRSRGEATSIIKHQGEGSESSVALDLSKLTDEELEVFQFLVSKCQPQAQAVEP